MDEHLENLTFLCLYCGKHDFSHLRPLKFFRYSKTILTEILGQRPFIPRPSQFCKKCQNFLENKVKKVRNAEELANALKEIKDNMYHFPVHIDFECEICTYCEVVTVGPRFFSAWKGDEDKEESITDLNYSMSSLLIPPDDGKDETIPQSAMPLSPDIGFGKLHEELLSTEKIYGNVPPIREREETDTQKIDIMLDWSSGVDSSREVNMMDISESRDEDFSPNAPSMELCEESIEERNDSLNFVPLTQRQSLQSPQYQSNISALSSPSQILLSPVHADFSQSPQFEASNSTPRTPSQRSAASDNAKIIQTIICVFNIEIVIPAASMQIQIFPVLPNISFKRSERSYFSALPIL